MNAVTHIYAAKQERWRNYVKVSERVQRHLVGAGRDLRAGSAILAWRRQLAERRRVL